MLIPPSLLFIYGLSPSNGRRAVYCRHRARLDPSGIAPILAMATCNLEWPKEIKAMQDNAADDESIKSAFLKLFPIISLVVLVIGEFGGIFTPTEAGAAGAFGALIIGLLKRKLDWKTLWKCSWKQATSRCRS